MDSGIFLNINPSILVMFFIIFITIFESIAQSCLKTYQKEEANLYIIVALFCYTLICFLLIQCYKNNAYLGHVNLMWSCFSIIFIIGVGCIFFDERFTSDDLMAILLAFGSIYYINRD